MKSPLTIAFITSRQKPNIYWFLSSLWLQMKRGMEVHILIIDLHRNTRREPAAIPIGMYEQLASFRWEPCKPTVWHGPHRLTKLDCWDVGSDRNGAFCLCKTEWIALLDDRCVLMPGWLDAISEAMAGNYAVFGAYEKRHGMSVKDGTIENPGMPAGSDSREKHCRDNNLSMPFKCPGNWSFGCNLALPLEWALVVNGYDEKYCGGASWEDVFLGMHMANNGFDLRYNYRMKVIQDRTPSELGEPMFRCDKGEIGTERDKSHEVVRRLKDLKRAPNDFDLRQMRETVLKGGKFPIPTEPRFDWFDSEPLETYGM